MPDLRAGAVSAATHLLGLPWRLNPTRGKPVSPTDPRLRRIAVFKPCCIGDLLMATPALAALRRSLPDAYINLVVGAWSEPAVANNPRPNGLTASPVSGGEAAFPMYRELAGMLKGEKYGTALVLDRSPLLNAVPRMAGIPLRAGLNSDGRGLALTHPVECPPTQVRHEVEWYLDVVRALGISAPSEDAYLEFYPSDADKAEAAALLGTIGDEPEAGYVALHIGGGSNPGMRLPSKRWHPQRWAHIVDWLAETYEPNVLLLGGPGEEDRRAADELLSGLFPATAAYVSDLVGKLSWGGMGALLSKCKLFLGHDTGAMHLATAMRVPVVAVFGPSDPRRYGPWDPSGHSIAVYNRSTNDNSDAGALRRAALSGELYHTAVSAEQVWKAVEQAYAAALRQEATRA